MDIARKKPKKYRTDNKSVVRNNKMCSLDILSTDEKQLISESKRLIKIELENIDTSSKASFIISSTLNKLRESIGTEKTNEIIDILNLEYYGFLK